METRFDEAGDWLWDAEIVECHPEEIARNGPKGICEVQEHNMEISSILFGGLDLIPYDASVFQAAREAWNPCFLHHGIDVVALSR